MLAACGGDEEVVAGSTGDSDSDQQQPSDSDTETDADTNADSDGETDMDADGESHDDGDTGSESGDASGEGFDIQSTTSHPELVSAQKWLIDDVITIDEQTLGVRYQAGAEPCSLANVTVTETDTSVTVLLETGLNPNAAAMSCIAQVFDYEIQVALDQPLGDREIIREAP